MVGRLGTLGRLETLNEIPIIPTIHTIPTAELSLGTSENNVGIKNNTRKMRGGGEDVGGEDVRGKCARVLKIIPAR